MEDTVHLLVMLEDHIIFLNFAISHCTHLSALRKDEKMRKRTRLIIDLANERKLVLAQIQEFLMSKTANDIILMLSEN